jgi:hypothetical protein
MSKKTDLKAIAMEPAADLSEVTAKQAAKLLGGRLSSMILICTPAMAPIAIGLHKRLGVSTVYVPAEALVGRHTWVLVGRKGAVYSRPVL